MHPTSARKGSPRSGSLPCYASSDGLVGPHDSPFGRIPPPMAEIPVTSMLVDRTFGSRLKASIRMIESPVLVQPLSPRSSWVRSRASRPGPKAFREAIEPERDGLIRSHLGLDRPGSSDCRIVKNPRGGIPLLLFIYENRRMANPRDAIRHDPAGTSACPGASVRLPDQRAEEHVVAPDQPVGVPTRRPCQRQRPVPRPELRIVP